MENLRLEVMNDKGDRIGCFFSLYDSFNKPEHNLKFCIKWEEYSHGDTDYLETKTVDFKTLMTVLNDSTAFLDGETKKIIESEFKKRTELNEKMKELEKIITSLKYDKQCLIKSVALLKES